MECLIRYQKNDEWKETHRYDSSDVFFYVQNLVEPTSKSRNSLEINQRLRYYRFLLEEI